MTPQRDLPFHTPSTFLGVKMPMPTCTHEGGLCSCRKVAVGHDKPHLSIATQDSTGQKFWVAFLRDVTVPYYRAWCRVGKTKEEAGFHLVSKFRVEGCA